MAILFMSDYRTISRCVTVGNKEIACGIEKQGNKTSFEITKMGTNTWMQVPVTYYKGYTAAVVDTNGKQFKLPVIKNKDSGLVEVNNKNVTSGIITVTYSGTWIQKVSVLLTFLTCCLWICIQLNLWKKG